MEMEKQRQAEIAAKRAAEEDDSDEVDFYDVQKAGTVDDIIMGMEKTKISKKKKKGDAVMQVTKEIKKPEKNSKNRMLKEKGKRKRSRSQLLH